MTSELDSLDQHETYTWVKRPSFKQVISAGWVFKKKAALHPGGPLRAKARLVAHGNRLKNLAWEEIFAPVVKQKSLRILMSICAQENLHIHKMDVKTAFLHGELESEVFVQPPKNVPRPPGCEDHVWLLNRSLYGLRQAPRCWNKKIHDFLISVGCRRLESDYGTYVFGYGDDQVLIAIYVDDILILGRHLHRIKIIKNHLSEKFDMVDFGEAEDILGLEINRDRENGTLTLTQTAYITDIVHKFNLQDSKPTPLPMECRSRLSAADCPSTPEAMADMELCPYREAVGSLMYLMTSTRPDIAAPVGFLSRYLCNPGRLHWEAAKRVLKYVYSTRTFGITYRREPAVNYHVYCDSDWAGDLDGRRSTTGWVAMLGGGAVAWQSRLQKAPAQSSCEAEYVAAGMAACEISWARGFFQELGRPMRDPTILESDSQSAIHVAHNPVNHDGTKHIDLKWHLTRHYDQEGKIKIRYLETSKQVADALTKAVPIAKLEFCRRAMGVGPPPTLS
jgi:hypothetical protein